MAQSTDTINNEPYETICNKPYENSNCINAAWGWGDHPVPKEIACLGTWGPPERMITPTPALSKNEK